MIGYRFRRLVCWAQGHSLVRVPLPPGWSVQHCRTCGLNVPAFRHSGGSR